MNPVNRDSILKPVLGDVLTFLLLLASSHQVILYSCSPIYPPVDSVSVFCSLQFQQSLSIDFRGHHPNPGYSDESVCVCMKERDRDKDIDKDQERETERKREGESYKNSPLYFSPFPILFFKYETMVFGQHSLSGFFNQNIF